MSRADRNIPLIFFFLFMFGSILGLHVPAPGHPKSIWHGLPLVVWALVRIVMVGWPFSEPPLIQHILQMGQVVGLRCSDWAHVPGPSLETLPDYRRCPDQDL